MEFCLYPIAHAAMFPFERGSQRSAGKEQSRREGRNNVIITVQPKKTPQNKITASLLIFMKHLRLWKLKAECILMSS